MTGICILLRSIFILLVQSCSSFETVHIMPTKIMHTTAWIGKRGDYLGTAFSMGKQGFVVQPA